jgi:polyisoprenoid-binding protein YceI
MKRHWKKIVAALVVLILLVVGGSWFYAKVYHKAPAELAPADLVTALDASVPAGSNGTAAPSTSSDDVSGAWQAVSTSLLRYRVNETINGFDKTAVGETHDISGTLTIDGTTVSKGDFTVDMTTVKSDESRRDNQFSGRVMDVAQFPTATFKITSPIQFGSVPAEGKILQTTATGDLTLHGTTKSVTFDLQALRKNGKIGIIGTIPVVFADYSIPNPTFATVTTDDHGVLEFIVVFVRS